MFPSILFVCLTLSVAFSAALVVETNIDDLVAVVQIFRHGQRNPISWYPNDPWNDESLYDLGPGQLTKVGKQMQYDLGKFTRGRYGSFLPRAYNPEWFKAQTTDVDRTHMSVQSNLVAMFTPTENETWNEDIPWQPIPVHPADPKVLSGSPDCEVYITEKANTVVSATWYVALNEVFEELYTYLSNNTGIKITNVIEACDIYDTIHIEDQFGFTLPEWTKTVYPEPLKTLSTYSFLSYSYTTEMKRLIAGSYLKTAVYDNFVNVFNDPTSYPKFQMWSAHDTNIASILNTFGAFDPPHTPAFASSIYFELRNSSGTPVINVYHKDDVLDIFEQVTISGCAFDCPLSDFPKVLSDYLIDTDTWAQECVKIPNVYNDDVAKAKERIKEIFNLKLSQ